MPFYDYTCPDCGTRFELMRKMAERDDPAACPKCGERKARRGLPRVQVQAHSSSSVDCPSAPSCPSAGGFG